MNGIFQALKSNRWTRRLMLAGTALLTAVNKVVPKDPKRILFYESMYDQPSDNTEAFCSWLIAQGQSKEYRLVYCAANPGMIDTRACKFVNKPRGVLEYLRSPYVFYSFGGMRIMPARGQTVVNFWHGTPLKAIGKLTSDEAYRTERLDDFTYILSASESFKPVMAQSFGCEEDKVLVQGLPRCDYLVLTRREDVETRLETVLGSDPAGRRLVLWMPTFRKSVDGRFDNGSVSAQTGLPVVTDPGGLDALDELAARYGCLVVIKWHAYGADVPLSRGNIVSVDNDAIAAAGLRLYEFVACFDALITDYSSIAFDYMLLNRPIAYTVDDISSYEATRGFTVDDPLAFMPGPKMESIEDIGEFLADVSAGEDPYREERRRVCDVVNERREGFCQSLAEKIGLTSKDAKTEAPQ